MTTSIAATRFLDRLVLTSRQQVVLRVVPLLATVAFTWLTVHLGSPYHPLLTVGLVVLAVGCGLLPDSSVPLFLVLALAATWALQVPETLSPWTLVGALLLTALHLACTLCGYGPPALALDRRTLGPWLPRALVMASATAIVWVGSAFLGGLGLPPGPAPLVLGLGVVLGWTAYLGRRLLSR